MGPTLESANYAVNSNEAAVAGGAAAPTGHAVIRKLIPGHGVASVLDVEVE